MLKTLVLSGFLVAISASAAMAQDYVLHNSAPINMRPGAYVNNTQNQQNNQSLYQDPNAPNANTSAGRKSYPDDTAAKATAASMYNQRLAEKRAQAVVQKKNMYPTNGPFPVGYGQ